MVHIEPGLRAFVITGLVTAGIVVTGLTGGDQKAAPAEQLMNPQVRELLKELRVGRGIWHPREKERYADRMRADAETWVSGVELLIEQPLHSYAPDGVRLLGILGTDSALILAREIGRNGHPTLRPDAITTAARIAPWPVDDLVAFLRDEQVATHRAAITAASGETAPEIQDALCAILEDQDSEMGAEAAAALPDPPDAQFLERLERVVLFAPVARKTEVLEALGRPGSADLVAPMFLRFLEFEEAEVVDIAIRGLHQLKTLPEGGEALWDYADNGQKDTQLRCRVLEVLERHPPHGDAAVGLLARTGPPEIRYHAVRVMIAQGVDGGLDAALQLVREGADGANGTPLQQAGHGARVLLQGALGTSPGGTYESIAEQLPRHNDRKRALPKAVNLFQTNTLGEVAK